MQIRLTRRVVSRTAAMLAVGGVLAACSGPSAGTPVAPITSTSSTNTQGSGLPHSGAPKVSEPIDTVRFESDPCKVLTAKQFRTIGLTLDESEGDPEGRAGATCDWFLPLGEGTVGATFLTANREGLSNAYAKNAAGQWDLFEPISPIAGHPAVIADMRDDRKRGVCFLQVGLRDDMSYNIGVQAATEKNALAKDPCGVAKKVAALALETMQGGG